LGGAMLRNVVVQAYPTIGGILGKHALIEWFMYPKFRGRIFQSSTTLQTVGVSYFVSAAS
jgi:hypothetical protein